MTDPMPLVLPFPGRDQTAGEVALDWVSRDDRLAHEVVLLSDTTRRSLLASVEGDDSMAWPPSPPIQEINRDTIGGRATHFGVGRAGTSHWSVSVQCDHGPAAGDAEPGELVFQWACRVKQRPIRLGVRYRLVQPRGDLPVGCLCRIDSGEAVWALRIQVGDRTVCRFTEEEIAIEPIDFDVENATIQWDYRIGWCRLGI